MSIAYNKKLKVEDSQHNN